MVVSKIAKTHRNSPKWQGVSPTMGWYLLHRRRTPCVRSEVKQTICWETDLGEIRLPLPAVRLMDAGHPKTIRR